MKKFGSPFEGIRLALFDLDGTLRKTRPDGTDALISYCADLGQTISKEQRRAVVRWSYKYWASNDLIARDKDRFEPEEFWRNIVSQQLQVMEVNGNKKDDIVSQVMARYRDDFSPEPYLPPGAKHLLWDLRSSGIRVGLVSNRNVPLTGEAIGLGIIEHLNFTLAAGQVKSWKPDSAIFWQALSMGGDVTPDEAVYIGDNYYADVVGAQRVGMRAVLIDEENAFPEATKECLVISQLGELQKYGQT